VFVLTTEKLWNADLHVVLSLASWNVFVLTSPTSRVNCLELAKSALASTLTIRTRRKDNSVPASDTSTLYVLLRLIERDGVDILVQLSDVHAILL
jgi:hypothetical protein